MHVATASQSAPLQGGSLFENPRERWLDGFAGALLGAWMTCCISLQIPEAQGLAAVASLGLFISRLARVWGLALSMLLLAYLLMDHPLWLRQDLLVRGGLLVALLNIWMMMALRVHRGETDSVAPPLETPLQDVERSLMPHSAQVKRDLDRAMADLSAERDRLKRIDQELAKTLQACSAEQQKSRDLEERLRQTMDQQRELQQALEHAEQQQLQLQNELAPIRLEAGELKEVLSRTMARAQNLEEENQLLEQLRESLRQAEQTTSDHENQLSEQSEKLQEALARLIEEQEQRQALQGLLQQTQGNQETYREHLDATRQDLERQERVADHLLSKVAELETELSQIQQSKALTKQFIEAYESLASLVRTSSMIRSHQRIKLVSELVCSWHAVETEWAATQEQLLQAQRVIAEQQETGEAATQMQGELARLQQKLVAQEDQAKRLFEERQDLLQAYQVMQTELMQAERTIKQKEAELLQVTDAHQKQAEIWETNTRQAIADMQAKLSGENHELDEELTQLRDQAAALEEALQSAQAQAQHAKSLLDMQVEETQKLRNDLADPQKQEMLKKATMLERQLAIKEQVIQRLQAQQSEVADLLKIKHQHLQLREQFEAHRATTEQWIAQCQRLEAENMALQEAAQGLEPTGTEQELLTLLRQTEDECAAWEMEALLAAQALRSLKHSGRL
jgi:chromosome segregation ATPase